MCVARQSQNLNNGKAQNGHYDMLNVYINIIIMTKYLGSANSLLKIEQDHTLQ